MSKASEWAEKHGTAVNKAKEEVGAVNMLCPTIESGYYSDTIARVTDEGCVKFTGNSVCPRDALRLAQWILENFSDSEVPDKFTAPESMYVSRRYLAKVWPEFWKNDVSGSLCVPPGESGHLCMKLWVALQKRIDEVGT